MLKRHEIQVLRRAGHTLTEVATLSGVSVGTVRRVVDEDAVTTVDNEAERDRRQVGRPPNEGGRARQPSQHFGLPPSSCCFGWRPSQSPPAALGWSPGAARPERRRPANGTPDDRSLVVGLEHPVRC